MNRSLLWSLLLLGLLGSSTCGPADGLDPTEVEGDEPTECFDGFDNDGDGLEDCDDPDCADAAPCVGDDDDDTTDDDDAADDDDSSATNDDDDSSAVPPQPDYVVRADGTADFTSIQAALDNASLAPGEIIEIQPDTPGLEQSFDESLSITSNGASGNYITVRGQAGEAIRISGSGILIDLSGAQYYEFQNLILGTDTDWSAATDGKDRKASKGVGTTDSTETGHIKFTDCTIYGGKDWGANRIEGSYFMFTNCTISLAGTNNNQTAPVGEDRLDLFQNKATYTVFEGCSFDHGGHDSLAAWGGYQVYRDCTFDGDWDEVFGSSNQFGPNETGASGARVAAFNTGTRDGFDPWGPVLVEDCVFKNGGTSGDGSAALNKLIGKHQIVRRNYYWDGEAEVVRRGVAPSTVTSDDTVKYLRFYHNTSYASGYVMKYSYGGSTTGHFQEDKYLNNLFQELQTPPTADRYVDWHINTSGQDGYPDFWKGAVFDGNLFSREGADLSGDIDIRLSGTTHELAAAKTNWPDVWLPNNNKAACDFVDPAARSKEGFALSSGPGLGDAVALTHAVGAGLSSTTLVVDDSLFFYDGWTMGTEFGEEPDSIQVGATTVQIANDGIDYDSHTITLKTSISWSDNDEVFLVDSDGTTVVDNRGAGQ
ncbi:MAG: hypothetical protein VX498_03230 [Myxococcota bacterium]|nr:hypothetical protein [Myxococcota bacterium]